MAKRKRKKKKQIESDHLIMKAVLAILLLALAIITALSFFDNAGTVGVVLNEFILSFLFGQTRFITPIIFVILAWYLLADIRYQYKPLHGIGAFLIFVSVSSWLHMPFDQDDMWAQTINGSGGGLLGMFAWPLRTYFGDMASWVIIGTMMLIGIVFLFNTSLLHFLTLHERLRDAWWNFCDWWSAQFSGLFRYETEEEEEDEEEEYDEDEYEEEEEDEYKDEYEEEYDEEIEEEELEEDPPSPRLRRVEKKPLFERRDVEVEEEKEYEEEEDLSTPADTLRDSSKINSEKAEPTQQTNQTHTIHALDEIPFWQKNAIIKPVPPVNLLQHRSGKATTGDLEENKLLIEETLREFNIDVTMDDVRVGPTVTQYTFRPARGVKISRITSLANDLALALAAHPIRIEAPIPGKSLVGIEIPNESSAMVSLRELIDSKQFKKRKHNLMIGLGKDVGGKVWFADLPRMPHLLIAGSTGSGKTVCMNTIITSLLYQNTAKTLRMIMVDPKRVELTLYNGIPHLLTPVITGVPDTINALKWTIGEMDRRFELLAKAKNRDINTYNAAHKKDPIPHLVFIIDELADLMITASQDVETGIIRLAQMARAVGIHLILATQRPSVDVITGLMKANIPGRIAFSVASLTDSRTILDSAGAEKLIGKGDMLLQTADLGKPVRIQGAFMSEEESKTIIDYLKGNDKPVYDESILNPNTAGQMKLFGNAPAQDDRDSLFEEAKALVIRSNKASASMLQRRLKVGYARAARILDELQEAGIVGPANGSKPRDILMTQEEADASTNLGGVVFTDSAPAEEPDEEEVDFEDELEDEEEEFENEEEDYEEDMSSPSGLRQVNSEEEEYEDDIADEEGEIEEEELENEEEYEDEFDAEDESELEEEYEDDEEEEYEENEEEADEEYEEEEDEDEVSRTRHDGKGNTFFY